MTRVNPIWKMNNNFRVLMLTVGLPASGKSTWARVWVDEAPQRRIRVNRDDIRKMLGPYWIPSREDLVTIIERSMVITALEEGYDVVVDATNFKTAPWYRLVESLERREIEVKLRIKDFTDVPIEECIARDAKRTGVEHVGAEVIQRFYNKYLANGKK